MPSQLALISCVLFVLFLLRIERKQASKVSSVLWIPTIWMLAIASKPMDTWFSYDGAGESGSPLDQMFLSGLLCLGLFILARKRFNWSCALKEYPWIFLLIAYMLVSVL